MEDTATIQEDRHSQDLRRERAQLLKRPTQHNAAQNEEVENLEKLIANKDKTAEFVMMGLLATIGSTLGAIPAIGGVISFVTGVGIAALSFTFAGKPKIKAQAINATGVVGDVALSFFGLNSLPEQIVTVLLIYLVVQHGAHKATGQLEQM